MNDLTFLHQYFDRVSQALDLADFLKQTLLYLRSQLGLLAVQLTVEHDNHSFCFLIQGNPNKKHQPVQILNHPNIQRPAKADKHPLTLQPEHLHNKDALFLDNLNEIELFFYPIRMDSKEIGQLLMLNQKGMPKDFLMDHQLMEILTKIMAENIKQKSHYTQLAAQLQKTEALLLFQEELQNEQDINLLLIKGLETIAQWMNSEKGFLCFVEEETSIKAAASYKLTLSWLKKLKWKKNHQPFTNGLLNIHQITCFTKKNLNKIFTGDPVNKIRRMIIAPLISFDIIGYCILVNVKEADSDFQWTDQSEDELFSLLTVFTHAIENKQILEKTLQMNRLNQSILKSIRAGVITTDSQGMINFINAGGQKILGCSEEYALGKNFLPFFNIEPNVQDSVSRNENLEIILTYDGEGGKKFLNFVINPLLDDYKKNLGKVIYFEDFTDYMLLQRQSQHNERLAALGEFSAGIAHEIKNPLTILRGFTDLLKDKKEDPAFIQKYLSLVPKEVERMNKIIENLLDFAKPSKQEQTKVDLHVILTNIKEIMDYDMKKKYIEMHLDLQDNGIITGEQGPLTQLFLNIILNSIQAINEKGNIWIKTKNIYENNKDFLYIIIEDDGTGIPPKILENIFNPFFTTKEKGTGLGLAIAFRIVQKHGGSIEVDHRREGGARFSLKLPR